MQAMKINRFLSDVVYSHPDMIQEVIMICYDCHDDITVPIPKIRNFIVTNIPYKSYR